MIVPGHFVRNGKDLSPQTRQQLEEEFDQHIGDSEQVIVIVSTIDPLSNPDANRAVLSLEEQEILLDQAGKRIGWNDPEMDIYDEYDKHYSQHLIS